MQSRDIVIIGGGPAGMAAAVAAREAGAEDILILERDSRLGGILNQCIHNGFGLHRFGEELTGPEYAARYAERVRELNIEVKLNTMVLNLSRQRVLTAAGPDGLLEIQAGAVVLAMGCRERPRGALNTPGTRPVGIYTAGTAQRFVNMDGYMPGRSVVILGSGDIGLIMARRMVLEGAKVHAVVELMPYSGGLKRNVVQCLDDYDIPLYLSHTVTNIIGNDRLEAVEISEVDENRRPIEGTQRVIDCDTLLLSVGLLPENELSTGAGVQLSPITGGAVVDETLQTSVPGVFSCGNVLHVHDLVDFVSAESALAGENAARFVQGICAAGQGLDVIAGNGVRYIVPATICPANVRESIDIRLRVTGPMRDRRVCVYMDGERVQQKRERILLPGEMVTVKMKKEIFDAHPNAQAITIVIEEAKA